MNKRFTYMFVMLLAALISYGGAGVNFVSYCCTDCRAVGMEALISDKCCDIHHHDHENEHCSNHVLPTEASCVCYISEADCCTLERVSFEWNQVAYPTFHLEPSVIDLFSTAITVVSLSVSPEFTDIIPAKPGDPPKIACPRSYLSLLSVLLI